MLEYTIRQIGSKPTPSIQPSVFTKQLYYDQNSSGYWYGPTKMNTAKPSLSSGTLPATILIAAYAIILSTASYFMYCNFHYEDFDLAIHTQSVRNILHGSIDSSILGIPFPGNHMALILFLISPVYAMFPSPLTLLYIQSIIVAAGAFGIFLLCRKEISARWALGLTAAYLTYPPLIYMNLYEFHPVALATSFLIFMVYFYKTGRFGLFSVFMTLALLCQENIALILMAFAVYALIDRKKRDRWVWVPLSIGICYFVISAGILMPMLNRNTVQFWQLYAHLGASPAQAVKNIVMHPVTTLQTVTDPGKIAFFSALFGPLGFLSLLNPLTLIPAIPAFCQRLLSDRLSETRIIFHYQAEFIPFIFISAVYGIKRLLESKHRLLRVIPAILLLIFPATAFLSSGLPVSIQKFCRPDSYDSHYLMPHAVNTALQKVPDNVPVAATFRLLPRLTSREKLYSLHHIYTGRYTLSTVAYPIPEDIRFVIIDTFDPLTFLNGGFYSPENYKNLQTLLSRGNWRVIEKYESILVLERTSQTPNKPPEIISFVTDDVPMKTNVTRECPGSIELAGFNLESRKQNHSTLLTLYWKKLCLDQQEYDVHLTITGQHRLYDGYLAPGSRIWPTQSWPVNVTTNAMIADKHEINLDLSNTDQEKIHLQVTVYPMAGRERAPISRTLKNSPNMAGPLPASAATALPAIDLPGITRATNSIYLIENHSTAFNIWHAGNIKGATLVHLDAHDDCRHIPREKIESLNKLVNARNYREIFNQSDIESSFRYKLKPDKFLFDLGNYIYPCILDGTISRFYWVLPEKQIDNNKASFLQQHLRAALKIPSLEFISATNGSFSCMLSNCTITITTLDSLPNIDKGALLDIDTDFFVFPCSLSESHIRGELSWDPKRVCSLLSIRVQDPAIITIASSISGGYLPVAFRFISDGLFIYFTSGAYPDDAVNQLKVITTMLSNSAALSPIRPRDPVFLAAHEHITGLSLMVNGDDKAGIASIERAARLNPAYTKALLDMADAYLSMDNPRRAHEMIDNFEKLTGCATTQSDAARVQVYLAEKELNRADTLSRKLISWNRTPYFLMLRGGVLAEQGLLKEAIRIYRETVNMQADNGTAYYNIGYVLAKQGKIEEAIENYQLALTLKPDIAIAHENLGYIMLNKGKYTEAASHLQTAVSLNPFNITSLNNLGLCLASQNQFTDAINCYNAALKLSPKRAEIHANLALAFINSGDNEAGIKQCKKALELKPNWPDVSNLMKVAEERRMEDKQ